MNDPRLSGGAFLRESSFGYVIASPADVVAFAGNTESDGWRYSNQATPSHRIVVDSLA
jgi:hypothetical protein